MKPNIENEKVIFAEGSTDINFFRSYLKHLSLDYQLISYAGNKLEEYLNFYLKNTESRDKVKVLGIIGDANGDFQASKTKITNIINKFKDLCSTYEIQIKSFLTPNNDSIGELETLLFNMQPKSPIKNCVESFYNCLEENNIPIKKRDKQKCSTYKFVLNKELSYDFDSLYLNKLKDFLKSL